jgi:2-(3-amino-3-carboxypropyl)histidine synthase
MLTGYESIMGKGKLVGEIRRRKARLVFLQVPEGLKMKVQELAKALEKSGAEVLVSIEPCYGGCDLRDLQARRLGCDLIVHVGHSDFGVKPGVPVIYEEYRLDFDPTPILKKGIKRLEKYKNIGLVTTVQYLESLEKVKVFLLTRGKNVLVGDSKKGSPGQVLGCDFSAAKVLEDIVDCFIYIGTGRFHPLGLSIEVSKPVFLLSAEDRKLEKLDQERKKLEISRGMGIQKARSARSFGILVSTKPGQMNVRKAEKAKKDLEGLGKKAWILVGDEITPDKLLGLDIEVLVNTACPRLREDWKSFKRTVIDVEDVKRLSK